MLISPLSTTAATQAAASRPFSPANPSGTRVALVLEGGAHGGVAQIGDTLTGYGRAQGYDSLANARRAAYMLTRGAERQAAGIFQQGTRFYVRALGEFTHHDNALLALHFEGKSVNITATQDPRLRLVVDGSTKFFTQQPFGQQP